MEQVPNNLRIYPKREKIFEMELKKLEKANISQRNKDLITEFQNYLFSTGTTGKQRIAKLSGQLRRICSKINTDLDKLSKGELIDLIALYNKDDRYSEDTKSDYRRVIKQFYKWFRDEDPRLQSEDKSIKLEIEKFYRYIQKEVKRTCKIKIVDFSKIITESEAQLVLDKGCKTIKEKAFVSLLHETGARVGEFLNIQVGDVEQKDNYSMLRLDGKTGERRIPIVRSIPYLLAFLEIHPYKNNNQSYLWIGENKRYMYEPLKHKGGQKLINRCFEAAKINKKHNFHWFRHSRATILAPKMTEAMLCKYMGWILGSNQVRRYCHLCTDQLEDVFLNMHGMKKIKDSSKEPIKCICGVMNDISLRYCYKCKRPLSTEVAIQDQELINSEINKTVQFMMEMAKNPELMKAFEEFKNKEKKQ